MQETLDTKKKEAREELQRWEDYLKKVSLLVVVVVGRLPEKGQSDGGVGKTTRKRLVHWWWWWWCEDYLNKISPLVMVVVGRLPEKGQSDGGGGGGKTA